MDFFVALFFVQNSQKTNQIKQFHQKPKLIKLNYKWKELKPKKLSQTDNKEMKPFGIKV